MALASAGREMRTSDGSEHMLDSVLWQAVSPLVGLALVRLPPDPTPGYQDVYAVILSIAHGEWVADATGIQAGTPCSATPPPSDIEQPLSATVVA